MHSRTILCRCLLCLLVGSSAVVSADDINYSGELSFAGNDNINNAWRAKDIREDSSLLARFDASKGYRLSPVSGVLLAGALQTEAHRNFDRTNYVSAKAAVAYRARPGTGFSSPAYTAEFSLREILSSSQIRDRTVLDLKFELFTRLTELTSMIAGLAYSQSEAEGEVFDQGRARLYANMDLLLNASSTLFVTYVFLSGDVVSVGTPDSLSLVLAADALEPDDAFGDGSITGALAYRLDADTHIVTLGYNRVINHGSSIDVSLRWLSSSAAQNIEYDSLTLRLGYLFQFE